MPHDIADPQKVCVFILSRSAIVRAGLDAWMSARVPVVSVGKSKEDYVSFASHRPIDVLLIDALTAGEFLQDLPTALKPSRTILLAAGSAPGERALVPSCAVCAWLAYDAETPALEHITSAVVKCTHGCAPELCAGCALPQTLKPLPLQLSRREFEIFEQISIGMGTTAIAAALGVSTKTVESQRERIKQKLRLRNGWELVGAAIAWRAGLLDMAREIQSMVSRPRRMLKSRPKR